MLIWCVGQALVSLGCFKFSTFVVIDREFASGLYNKIAQLIEGKHRLVVFFLGVMDNHNYNRSYIWLFIFFSGFEVSCLKLRNTPHIMLICLILLFWFQD